MQTHLEIIIDDGNLCGEGPFWDDRSQALYWTDITGHRFFRYDWRRQRRDVLSDSFEVAGFCPQEKGGFLVTNHHGIWLWEPGANPLVLATQAEGQECVMNDCAADPLGRVYSGSWHLDEQGSSAPSFLFRIDADGSVHIADEGICFSNGLAFSPDESTLSTFADTVARCIYAYDWRRVLTRIDRSEGVPDGLAVDEDGFVWCAHWFGGCLTRYDPDGKRERRIELPAAQTSSLCFGGPDLDEIYVTSAARSNSLMLAPEGYDPTQRLIGGALYRLRTGIRGLRKYRSNLSRAALEQVATPNSSHPKEP